MSVLNRVLAASVVSALVVIGLAPHTTWADGKTSEARTVEQAEVELYGDAEDVRALVSAADVTKYFGLYNQSTKPKYRVIVQYRFKGGIFPRPFNEDSWREVEPGDYRLPDVEYLDRQVTAVRFWWKDKDAFVAPFDDTGWVRAAEGHYMYYAICDWRDGGEKVHHYDRPFPPKEEPQSK